MLSASELYKIYGKVVLMAGSSCRSWTARDVQLAINTCKALGIDTLSMKVADGAQVWHTPEEYASYRAMALSAGVGLVPFMYAYTRKQFGASQLQAQANLIRAYMEKNENAGMVINMEVEFDSQTSEAQAFAALLHNLPGPLVISTWANPSAHGYSGVVQAFKGVAALWGPEEYTDHLATDENQYPAWALLAPEIDLTSEFGANNQLAIVQQAKARGHESVWLWSYEASPSRHNLIAEIVAAMHDATPVAPPEPTPEPAGKTYTVVSGDTLSEIAARNPGTGTYQNWYNANKTAIDEKAQAAGKPAPYYNWIFPGEVLNIPG